MIVAVPLVVVALKGPNFMLADSSSMVERMTDIERMRPYAIRSYGLGKDESISPLDAGRALHRLQSGKPRDAFPMHDVGTKHVRPWTTLPMTPDMFSDVGQDFTQRQSERIITAVGDGVSPAELAWLKAVAEAGIWADFDLVARAPSLDVIGAQYKLPFSEKASVIEMSIPRFQDTKELVNAAVARAAYHIAIGDNAGAERVLRGVVSFGFAYIDNAHHTMDAFIGRTLVEIGRDGLAQFYEVTGLPVDDGAALERTVFAPLEPADGGVERESLQRRRSALMAAAADPALSRGLRMEALRNLAFGVCTNVGELITGHSDEVIAAYATARNSIARYPSEVALLDLMLESANRVPPDARGSFSDRLIAGTGEIASTVLRNPRISGCTRLALSHSN